MNKGLFVVMVIVSGALGTLVTLTGAVVTLVLGNRKVAGGSREAAWAWTQMRKELKLYRMMSAVCIGLLFDCILAVILMLVLVNIVGPDQAWLIGGVFVIVAGSVFAFGFQIILEDPTHARFKSYVHARLLHRGVHMDTISAGWLVGASAAPGAKKEGDWSDNVGVLSMAPSAVVFHGDVEEITIRRDKVHSIVRQAPRGDSLSLCGVSVIGITWSDEDGNRHTLYFLGRGGRTAFSYKTDTNRLHAELLRWAPVPTA